MLAELPSNPYAVLVPMVLGVTILMLVTIRRMSMSRDSQRTGKSTRRNYQQEHIIRDNLEQLCVELQEMSRQIYGEIDTRTTRLEILIRQADERIARLESLMAAQQQHTSQLHNYESTSSDDTSDQSAEDPTRALIYQLADEGKSSLDIARQTSQTTGEVELLLALRKGRAQAQASTTIDRRV